MKQRVINVLAIIGALALILGAWYFFFGNHDYWVEGETFWELMHEKGHWYLELFIGAVEMIVVDIFFGLIVWKLVIKPHIHRDLEHRDHDHEPDEEHD